MSNPYRTTLNFNTNRPDKAMALEWLLHLQQMHPELSISDIVSRLLIEDRNRILEAHDTNKTMRELMKMDLIRKNVCKNCELPPLRKNEMHPLTKEEMGTFMKLAKDDEYYLMMRFDFFTGLRESELIGLTWDCVDFEKHSLRVYRQFVRIASGPDKGKMMYTLLKNGKERTITLTTTAMTVLLDARRRQSEQRLRAGSSWHNEYNMIFTRSNGMFVRFKTLYVHFKDIVRDLGRPEVRFHDVRHTYATLSLQSHVDPKTLSEALGHATVAFTLDTYGHCNEDMKQQAADQLEKLICQY